MQTSAHKEGQEDAIKYAIKAVALNARTLAKLCAEEILCNRNRLALENLLEHPNEFIEEVRERLSSNYKHAILVSFTIENKSTKFNQQDKS